jgi:hypothetical protein
LVRERLVGERYGACVAKRAIRRFGPGPYVLGFVRDEELWGKGFPFDVPALSAIEQLRLDAPVTLLAGENGAGKSTILELVAEAIGFAAQGGELERLGELPALLGSAGSLLHEEFLGATAEPELSRGLVDAEPV